MQQQAQQAARKRLAAEQAAAKAVPCLPLSGAGVRRRAIKDTEGVGTDQKAFAIPKGTTAVDLPRLPKSREGGTPKGEHRVFCTLEAGATQKPESAAPLRDRALAPAVQGVPAEEKEAPKADAVPPR